MSRHQAREHLRRKSRRRTPPGAMPGTMTTDPDAPVGVIELMGFSPGDFTEVRIHDVSELQAHLNKWAVCWINVDGLGDLTLLRRLGELFRIHPLALEDVVNVHQRPKVEHYDKHLFIVTHMLTHREGHLQTEQVSLFLGQKFVLTFQERPGWDCLTPVRERIRKGLGLIRNSGPDYLAYALLDAIIDHYFPVLESFGEHLEALEDKIVTCAEQSDITHVHEAKRELLFIRRIIWPQRESLNILIRDASPLIADETRIYFRDCYDHAIRLIDILETDREVCSDLMDLYLSSISHRLNEVMKVLTVISSLFIPLTFVSSIYGMNFDTQASPWNMPELNWRYGYPWCLALMGVIAATQLVFFWQRGWIGSRRAACRKRVEAAGPTQPAPGPPN